MKKEDVTQAAAILSRAAETLQTLPVDKTTRVAADVRRYCGYLSAYANWSVRSAVVSRNMLVCLNLAFQAGTTDEAFGHLRAQVEGEDTSTGEVTRATAAALVRLIVIFEVKALTLHEWRSRNEVEDAIRRVNLAIEAAKASVAGNRSVQTYRQLGALHAAIIRDLSVRARPLPRMAAYANGGLPSAALSYRLYGTAERARELAKENRVPHPLFMPPTGRALSA